jgi:hypothetical protein
MTLALVRKGGTLMIGDGMHRSSARAGVPFAASAFRGASR